MIPALLDCDTGHDDAMAILMAGRRLDLRGVTTVFGNATVADTTANTCRILELAGLAHVPVAAGAAAPLEGTFVHESGVHGMTGMDGHDLPPPAGGAIDESAVDFIARNIDATRGLHLVATGPLTNIARVLTSFPGTRAALAGISIMGGSTGQGNATPVAEYNIQADPEAADIVFNSGVPIRMVGLNVTRQVAATPERRHCLRSLGNRTGQVVADLLDFFSDRLEERYGLAGASMHDPLAVAALCDPDMLRFEAMEVSIEREGAHTRGMTVCDLRHLCPLTLRRQREPLGCPNAEVAVAVDAGLFWERFIEVVAACP